MATKPKRARYVAKEYTTAFRIPMALHLRVKLIAGAERRQINHMYRELVFRALEDAEERMKASKPSRADREFPDVPSPREARA